MPQVVPRAPQLGQTPKPPPGFSQAASEAVLDGAVAVAPLATAAEVHVRLHRDPVRALAQRHIRRDRDHERAPRVGQRQVRPLGHLRTRKTGSVVVETHVRARSRAGAVVIDTARVDLVDVPGLPGGNDEVICQLVVVLVERALEVLRRGRVRPCVVVLVVQHDRRRSRPCRAMHAKRDAAAPSARRADARTCRLRRRPPRALQPRRGFREHVQKHADPHARPVTQRTSHSVSPP